MGIIDTRHAIVDTHLGEVTLVASDDSLVGLYVPHHWYKPAEDTCGAQVAAATDALLVAARSQLDDYLDGARTSFDLPTATHGDPFQEGGVSPNRRNFCHLSLGPTTMAFPGCKSPIAACAENL